MKKKVSIRFYEELNDALDPAKRKKEFKVSIRGISSIKALIDSLGVSPADVDLVLVNGRSVPFAYAPQDGDRISVYPMFETFDISDVSRLREEPLRRPKFILEAGLGKLAQYLRTAGLDVRYKHDSKPYEIIAQSIAEQRTILTRRPSLYSSTDVVRCYRVKHSVSKQQFHEVMNRFDLQ